MKLKYYLLTAVMLSISLSATADIEEPPVNQFCDTEEPEIRRVNIQAILASNNEEEPPVEQFCDVCKPELKRVNLQAILALNDTEEPEEPTLDIQTISNDTPYRLLANKDPQGWNVELDDGAIWRAVDSSSAYQITHWRTNDPLVIHPTFAPGWSGGRYYILNERLNSIAIVELSAGPILNRATNSQITYIDYSSGVVQIQDGAGRASYFRLDYADRTNFQKWRPGQSVILGSNADCYAGWFSSHQFILINVEANTYACATLD